jgi:RHS repeat-associated protein
LLISDQVDALGNLVPANRLYALQNSTYSVHALVNDAGAVVEKYSYTPYGEPTVLSPAGIPLAVSAVGNNYLFTGRELDAETGLFHFRARAYSPKLGRFLQRDTQFRDGMNLYEFAGSRATARTDPYGRQSSLPRDEHERLTEAFHVKGVRGVLHLEKIRAAIREHAAEVDAALKVKDGARIRAAYFRYQKVVEQFIARQEVLVALYRTAVDDFKVTFEANIPVPHNLGTDLKSVDIQRWMDMDAEEGIRTDLHEDVKKAIARHQLPTDEEMEAGEETTARYVLELAVEQIPGGDAVLILTGKKEANLGNILVAGLGIIPGGKLVSILGKVFERVKGALQGANRLARAGKKTRDRLQSYRAAKTVAEAEKLEREAKQAEWAARRAQQRAAALRGPPIAQAKRLKPAERLTAERLQRARGIKLYESAAEGADFVDELGRTYDAVGGIGASTHWDEKQFLKSLFEHVAHKTNDFTVVDLVGYAQHQIEAVKKYVGGLPPNLQAKIIRLGF